MSFSDWITITSILIAVLLAVFKFDEWEIIRLKNLKLIFLVPLLALIISGISSYYNSNPHPEFLNFLWNKNGLQSGFWPIIWIIIFFTNVYFTWHKLTHSKPSEELVKKYYDYLSIYEPVKFSSLFRKYEKYILSTDEFALRPYEKLLEEEKFWLIASTHLKELLIKEPKKLYNVREALKILLSSQLANLPTTLISKELEKQKNNELSDYTPILNIFLSTATFIEEAQKKGIFINTIKVEANEYLSSNKFLKEEKESFILKPSDNVSEQVAPKQLIIFYYIQLIDSYWYQVFNEKSKGFPWFGYADWTKHLLTEAPKIVEDFLPNHYILAIDKMLENICSWVRKLNGNSKELEKMTNHIQDFNELKIKILLEIQKNHFDKVSERWFEEKLENLLHEIIIGKNLLNKNYDDREVKKLIIKLTNLKSAFEKLTDGCFYSEQEKDNNGYQWVKEIIDSTY